MPLGSKWGKLDCLVNNAGVWLHNPMSQLDENKLIASLRINVRGPFLCLHHALPYLRLSKTASVVNLGSTAGQRGEAFYSPYAASKGAVDTMTVGLAREVADEGIRVIGVRPGLIETEIHASGGRPERIAELQGTVPMRRPGRADEVAHAVVWLCSDEASYVTGAMLDVGGGR